MEVERVERHIIKSTHSLYKYCDQMCLKSKNLYNLANYYIRQIFIALSKKERSQEQQQLIEEVNSKIPSFNKRREDNFKKKKEKNPSKYAKRLFKPMSILGEKHKYLGYDFLDFFMRAYQDYQILPQQTAQQTLRLLNKNWKAFFESIKDYKKQPSKYTGRPNLPKYKKKDGRQIAIFTNQQCRLEENFIRFPYTQLKLQTTIKEGFQQVRIAPKDACYIVEVVYKKTAQQVCIGSERRILGIDLGVDNFATCVNNIALDPFIINGKDVKSINQYYNKKKAVLMSYVGNKGTSRRMKNLTHKRNNKIDYYMHKASKDIFDYCLKHSINTIVIGLNPRWKQEINLGKANNQNFTNIAHSDFIRMMKYKGEEVGIEVIANEESYTSKASFLDGDDIPVYDPQADKHTKHHFSGKRVSRGLYKSSNGILINADVNAAYNIILKVFPNAFAEGIEGVGFRPLRRQLLAKR